ncbi:hypothetical protein AAMO2058_000334800 [Amorphochlora amoebiformis]
MRVVVWLFLLGFPVDSSKEALKKGRKAPAVDPKKSFPSKRKHRIPPGSRLKSQSFPDKKTGKKTLKYQIRSIERLLRTKNMDSLKRCGLEKRLAELHSNLSIFNLNRTQREHDKKYTKIKLIERKKAKRMLKRAEKLPESSRNKSIAIQQARDAVEYVTCFPKTEKYISLFKNFDPTDEQYEGQQRRLEKVRKELMTKIKAKAAHPKSNRNTI